MKLIIITAFLLASSSAFSEVNLNNNVYKLILWPQNGLKIGNINSNPQTPSPDEDIPSPDELPFSLTNGSIDVTITPTKLKALKTGTEQIKITNNGENPLLLDLVLNGDTVLGGWDGFTPTMGQSPQEREWCPYKRNLVPVEDGYSPTQLYDYRTIAPGETKTWEVVSDWRLWGNNPDDVAPGDDWLLVTYDNTNYPTAPFSPCESFLEAQVYLWDDVEYIDLETTIPSDGWDLSDEIAWASGIPVITFFQPTNYAHKVPSGGERIQLDGNATSVTADPLVNNNNDIGLNIIDDSWSCEIFSDQSHPLVVMPFEIHNNTNTTNTYSVTVSNLSNSNYMNVNGIAGNYSISGGNSKTGTLTLDVSKEAESLNDPSNGYQFNINITGILRSGAKSETMTTTVKLNMSSGSGTECHLGFIQN